VFSQELVNQLSLLGYEVAASSHHFGEPRENFCLTLTFDDLSI
jgi:hypothetical protein